SASVKKYSATGAYKGRWTWTDGQFTSPAGIAADDNGFIYSLYVDASLSGIVRKTKSDGTLITTWPTAQRFATGVACDKVFGMVYVATSTAILKYDRNGNLLAIVGSAGTGPGHFTDVLSVAVDRDGTMYALQDLASDCVQKFTPNGVLRVSWGTHGVGDGQFN